MSRDPTSTGPSVGTMLSNWRSYRNAHRVFLVVFVLATIFVLDRYRVALAGTFSSAVASNNGNNSPAAAPPVVPHTPPANTPSVPTTPKEEPHSEPAEEEEEEDEVEAPVVEETPQKDESPPKKEDTKSSTPASSSAPPSSADAESRQEQSMANAGNSTLGFHGIYYINMKNRYDREDAMAVQAYISGLDIEDREAVLADDIDPVGMPPTHRPGLIRAGEKGCWRAHANIWSEMVRNKLPPVLILESDAAWDINIRPIMSNMNKHFIQFMRQINSTAVHDPSWGAKHNRGYVTGGPSKGKKPTDENGDAIDFNPEDPWLSEHWDLFSFGQCFEYNQDHEINLVYPDPHMPPGADYWGKTLGNERVIRKSGGITCTTSYAISHTGAAKLLLRSAIDLDNPVDLLIRRLTMSRDLVAYSVMPPVIAQWEYRGDVGMNERGAQSDINGGKHKDTPPDAKMDGWEKISGDKASVWKTKGHHKDVHFEKMALEVAWEQVLGPDAVLKASWFNAKTGDK